MSTQSISGSIDLQPSDRVVRTKHKKIIRGSIAHAFLNDVWVRAFVHECIELFGFPATSSTCMSSKDKFFYTFSLMGVTSAMRRMPETWRGMHEKVEPDAAAWEFCRRFYEKYGHHVINREDEVGVKALPGLLKKSLKSFQVLPSGSSG